MLLCMAVTLPSHATNILGKPVATPQRMYQYGLSKGAGQGGYGNGCFTLELCKIYYDLGVKYGIRGDIALCQSFWETGWFKFTGGTAMRPNHHNYCGLGVTSLGTVGCTFPNDATGVAAQLQHLWAYATTQPLPSGWTLVDPRFNYVKKGCAGTWENLGYGHWAAAAAYGTNIMGTYNEMMAFKMSNPALTVSPATVTLTAQQGATKPSAKITVKGTNLNTAISFNSSTSYVTVSKNAGWDDFKGGTLTVTLDTSKSPVTFNQNHYIAIISGSDVRKQVQLSGGVTAKPEPAITVSPTALEFSAKKGQSGVSKTLKVTAKDLDRDLVYGTNLASLYTVTAGSDWNARTGGTLTVALNTDRDAGTYSTGYVYVQTTSALRQTVNINTVITDNGVNPTPTPSLSMSPATLTLSAVQGASNPTATLTVSGHNLSSDIVYNSSSSAVTLSPASGWNARTGGQLIATLDASKAPGTYNATISVQSGTARATSTVTGTIAASSSGGEIPPLNFKEIWNLSTTAGNADFASACRNMDVDANGKMYCVHSNKEIYILDARTGVKVGSLPLTGVSGGTLTLIDVKCYKNRIYACNLKGDANKELHVYEWTSDEADPTCILSTSATEGIARVGDCLGVSGDPNGQLVLSFAGDDGSNTAIIEFTGNRNSWSSKKITVSNLSIGSSPRAIKTTDGYWLIGGSTLPTFVNGSGVKQYTLSGESVASGNDIRTFSYDGKNYALVTSYLNKSATSLAEGVMNLYEVDSSWKGTNKVSMPSAGLGAKRNTTFSTSLAINPCEKCVEAWVLIQGQGIAYYRSGDIGGCTPDPGPEPGPDPVPEPITSLPTKFTTDWSYSQNEKTINPDYFDLGGNLSRNMTLFGNHLYIVQRASDNADIVIANAMTGERLGTLPADDLTGGAWKFSSVASLSDAVVACNLATSATGTLKVYAWTSDSATPVEILSTTNHGARSGDLLSASGSLANGKLYLSSNTGYAGKIYVYTVSNGKASATPQVITLKDDSGDDYNLGGDFAVIDIRANADGTFYASGKGGHSGLFNADGTLIKLFDSSVFTESNTFGSSMHVIDYGPFKLAASTAYRSNSIEQGYLALSNVTDGIDKATKLNHYPTLGKSSTRNATFVSTALGRVDGKKLHLWVMIPGQGIAKYTASDFASSADDATIDPVAPESIIILGNIVTTTLQNATAIAAYTPAGTLAAKTYGPALDTSSLTRGLYIIMATLPDGTTLTTKALVR